MHQQQIDIVDTQVFETLVDRLTELHGPDDLGKFVSILGPELLSVLNESLILGYLHLQVLLDLLLLGGGLLLTLRLRRRA